MKLHELCTPTAVVRAGMTVGEVFRECAERGVPGLPFVDEGGRVVGRISLRDVLKRTCVPSYVLKAAHLLGDQLPNVTIPEVQVRSLLTQRAEAFVLEDLARLNPRSPVLKALALMELHNTSYLFLIDGEAYQGVVTRMTVVRAMLRVPPEQPL